MTAVALIIVSIMKYTLGSDDYCDSARDDDCCALDYCQFMKYYIDSLDSGDDCDSARDDDCYALDYCVNCELARSLARHAVILFI